MTFTTLPPQLQYQVYLLTQDQQFQLRFGTDEVLNQLDQLKYDPVIEYNQVQFLFHNKVKILGVELEPVTLGLWSYLYTLKSPIVFNDEEISSIDIDLFFYLLQTKDFGSAVDELFVKSMNYCQKSLHITEQKASQIIQNLVKISFRVLNMFPRLQAEKKAVFNADWITSIVTKVKQVSSYSTQEIYKDIPICEVYYLFAQYCRQRGSEAIYLRTEEEIMIEQDLRCSQLVVERLIELGHIAEANKSYYIDQIHDIVGGKE